MLHCNSASVSLCNRIGGFQQEENRWLRLAMLVPALLLWPHGAAQEFSVGVAGGGFDRYRQMNDGLMDIWMND